MTIVLSRNAGLVRSASAKAGASLWSSGNPLGCFAINSFTDPDVACMSDNETPSIHSQPSHEGNH